MKNKSLLNHQMKPNERKAEEWAQGRRRKQKEQGHQPTKNGGREMLMKAGKLVRSQRCSVGGRHIAHPEYNTQLPREFGSTQVVQPPMG